MRGDPKTDKQRSALHVWLRQAAQVLNDNGIEKRSVLERLQTRGIDTQWTGDSFKEDVYKPIYQKVNAQESTEEANTTDHDIVYNGLVRWVGQEYGVTLPPWPEEEGRKWPQS